MPNRKRFPFIERRNSLGVASTMPYMPLTLTYRNTSLEVMGLLDTGASVNVLPYQIGVQLGAVWEEILPDHITRRMSRFFLTKSPRADQLRTQSNRRLGQPF